jgi:hypothetical protein
LSTYGGGVRQIAYVFFFPRITMNSTIATITAIRSHHIGPRPAGAAGGGAGGAALGSGAGGGVAGGVAAGAAGGVAAGAAAMVVGAFVGAGSALDLASVA